MANVKTNAIRIIETAGIEHVLHSYPCKEAIDGLTVAQKLGADVSVVFKTLVTKGKSGNYFVFVVPAAHELDLKKAAGAVGEKSVEMIHVKDLLKVTGYIRGGCSPVGMKKSYGTVFDISAADKEKIFVSAGKIGFQVEINPESLCKLVDGKFEDIVM